MYAVGVSEENVGYIEERLVIVIIIVIEYPLKRENSADEGGHTMIFDNIMFHNVEELEESDKGYKM